ncbi:MAG: hypothetical protein DRP76_01105 [Candidatus Omnitrophota bacterium]|nr:MAG: hypothetical protein DRP76_01105 [Candidatus Omnitrophota bacterium]
MKGVRIGIGILFVVWIVSVIIGYNFYLVQREKIRKLYDENSILLQKVSSQKREMAKLKEMVEVLDTKVEASIEKLNRKISSNTLKNEAVSSLVERMRRNIKEWQKNYCNILTEIKQYLERWQKDIASKETSSPKVELGEISIEKK